MRMDYKLTVALIYDFDGTLSPGNMQEYDFIPAVGKSNREFWNDANMLAMGGGLIGNNMADRIVDAFLNTPFEGGRHQRRIDQIADIENGRL